MTSVQFGVELADAGSGSSQPVRVKLYRKTNPAGSLTYGNLTTIATVNTNISDGRPPSDGEHRRRAGGVGSGGGGVYTQWPDGRQLLLYRLELGRTDRPQLSGGADLWDQ